MTIKALQLLTKQHRATMASTKEMKEEKENSNRKKRKEKSRPGMRDETLT